MNRSRPYRTRIVNIAFRIFSPVLSLVVITVLPCLSSEAGTKRWVIIVRGDVARPSSSVQGPTARNESEALYDLIKKACPLESESQEVVLLPAGDRSGNENKSPPANKLLESVASALRKAGAYDTFVVIFVGDGVLQKEGSYLLMNSVAPDLRLQNSVPLPDLADVFRRMKGTQRLIAIIDASVAPGQGGQAYDPEVFYRYLIADDPTGSADGKTLFLATGDNADRAFVHTVVRGLRGDADIDGHEADGVITAAELSQFLEKEFAKGVLVSKANTSKRPFVIVGDRSSQTALGYDPSVRSKIKAKLDKLDHLAQANLLSAELKEEGKALIRRMPRTPEGQKLRTAYDELIGGVSSIDDLRKVRQELCEDNVVNQLHSERFADAMFGAADLIKRKYIKELTHKDLIVAGLTGLFRYLGEDIPADILERTANAGDREELLALCRYVRCRVGRRKDLQNDNAINIALKSMAGSLDAFSRYADPLTVKLYKQLGARAVATVGIEVTRDAAGNISVVTPIKGSPAYDKGVRARDTIAEITLFSNEEGKPLKQPMPVQMGKLSLVEVGRLLRGRPGTRIKLTICREGVREPLEFDLPFVYVERERVLGFQRKPDDSWDYVVDPENNIGYIRLSGFYGNSGAQLGDVLATLQKRALAGLVLDLRGNRGGLVANAGRVCDYFLASGTIVTIRDRDGHEETYKARGGDKLHGTPIVCLVNKFTASSSEVVAACLQDHKRAIVIGERSFGKGSLQETLPFEGGEFIITVARMWRPRMMNLDREGSHGSDDWGVCPSEGFEVKVSAVDRTRLGYQFALKERILPLESRRILFEFKDTQLDMALRYLRSKIKPISDVPLKKPA